MRTPLPRFSRVSSSGPLFHPEITRLLEIGCMGVIFVLYALLKAKTLHLTSGDEGLWFYVAKLWADGVIPYRDFFVSHPPLQFALPAILFLIGRPSLPFLNTIPAIVVSGISGLLVYRIARREWGFLAAFLATTLFLFSENQLFQSNHFTGMNFTVMFLLWGMDLFLRGHLSSAGMVLGMGTMTGIYILPGVVLLCCIALRSMPHTLRPFGAGFAAFLVPVHGVFLLIAGNRFLEQVYLYHLRKIPNSPYFASVPSIFVSVAGQERMLILFILLALHFLLLLPKREKGGALLFLPPFLAGIAVLFIVDFLLFFSLLQRSFNHYFLLVIPFGALVASYGLVNVLRLPFRRICSTLPEKLQNICSRFLSFIAPVFIILAVGNALFLAIAPYSHVSHTAYFRAAYDLAQYVRDTVPEERSIYGDFGIVPTIALLSGRRIAAHEAESSIMRFDSGMYDIQDVITKIEGDAVEMVIFRRTADPGLISGFQEYLRKHYALERIFQQGDSGHDVEVWRKTSPLHLDKLNSLPLRKE